MRRLIPSIRIISLLLFFNSFSLPTMVAQICVNTNVTTLAGGSEGSTDANGSAASFNLPYGMTADAAGNIYVTDRRNHTIRKITPNGNVTTIAGMVGITGNEDGIGAAAQFNNPTAVTADNSGNLYVSDRSNRRIRKINSSGVVSTLAGSSNGHVDGTGTAAKFEFPTAINMSVDGFLYVADASTVRKINPTTGEVTTIAGQYQDQQVLDGTGLAARFKFAHGITSDPSSNLYISEFNGHVIRKITPAGVVTTIAGDGGAAGTQDGTGTAAQFSFTSGLTSDSQGNIFIADQGSDLIRKMTPAGVVTTFAGTANADGFNNGPLNQATFNNPTAIGIDGFGNIYISEINNNAVRKIGDCAAPAAVTFGFSSFLSETNPSNCNTGGELYYADTLRIPATGTLQTGLDFRINTSEDFFIAVPCSGATVRGAAVGRSGLMAPELGLGGTAIKETALGSGVYKIAFWATASKPTAVTVVESRNVTGAPAGAGAGGFPALLNPPAVATAPIPTMSQWGLLVFGLLILNLSVFFVGRVEFK